MDRSEEYEAMSGTELFPTAVFGGFRKDDVLEHLDFLARDLEKLRKKNKELEQELSDKDARLQQELSRSGRIERLLDEADQEREDVEALRCELDDRIKERDRLQAECERFRPRLEAVEQELAAYNDLKQAYRKIQQENEFLRQEKDRFERERRELALLREDNDRLQQEKEAARRDKELLRLEKETIRREKETLRQEKAKLKQGREEQERLAAECAQLRQDRRMLERELTESEQRTESIVRGAVDQNVGHMKLITQQLQEYLDVLNSMCQGIERARGRLNRPVITIQKDDEIFQQDAGRDIGTDIDFDKMDGML